MSCQKTKLPKIITRNCAICDEQFSFPTGFRMGSNNKKLCGRERCRVLYLRIYQRKCNPPATRYKPSKSNYELRERSNYQILFYDFLYYFFDENKDILFDFYDGNILLDEDAWEVAGELSNFVESCLDEQSTKKWKYL